MNIINRMESSLPTVSGTISGTGAEIGGRVEDDLAFWSGKTESDSAAYSRLEDYWSHVGYTDWTPGGTPWSAAWISYQLRGTGFKPSAGHWAYTESIIGGDSPGWKAYSIPKNNGRISLNVGDVIVKARSGSDTAGHGDIVYKIQGDKAFLAGGNLSDSARTTHTITMVDGLATIPGYQILLKKTGGSKFPPWWLIGGMGMVGAWIWSRKK